MSFLDDIRAFKEKALTAASDNTNKIFSYAFTHTVDNSPTEGLGPYSTGHLKANWFPTSGEQYSTETTSEVDPSGASSISRIESLVAEDLFYGRDNIVSLSNSLDYAYRAEVLAWPKGIDPVSGWRWSGRSLVPYAMISKSVQQTLNEFS